MKNYINKKIKPIYDFLCEIDNDFPVPLSVKTDLEKLAIKFATNATICTEAQDNKIIGMVAGYTKNTVNSLGYISVVGVSKNHRGKHIAVNLLNQFIALAQNEGLDGVHIYTHSTNQTAIKLYKRMGFTIFHEKNELRPDDIHLIYLFNNNGRDSTQ